MYSQVSISIAIPLNCLLLPENQIFRRSLHILTGTKITKLNLFLFVYDRITVSIKYCNNCLPTDLFKYRSKSICECCCLPLH